MFLPEHAEIIRLAVRATARYYGIKIGDLGDGATWVDTAMRNATPLSLEAALQLYRFVQQPPHQLVGRKRPQGPSLAEMAPVVLLFKQDPIANPLPKNATSDHLSLKFEAAAILNSYAVPFPGSSLFVAPGAAAPLAHSLVDSFVEKLTTSEISTGARRKLAVFLEHAFMVAERPFYTEDGRQLLPYLMRLGVANRRDVMRVITEQFPDQVDNDVETTTNALIAAEERRAVALQERLEKSSRSKRKVTMPRIRDALK